MAATRSGPCWFWFRYLQSTFTRIYFDSGWCVHSNYCSAPPMWQSLCKRGFATTRCHIGVLLLSKSFAHNEGKMLPSSSTGRKPPIITKRKRFWSDPESGYTRFRLEKLQEISEWELFDAPVMQSHKYFQISYLRCSKGTTGRPDIPGFYKWLGVVGVCKIHEMN